MSYEVQLAICAPLGRVGGRPTMGKVEEFSEEAQRLLRRTAPTRLPGGFVSQAMPATSGGCINNKSEQ